MLEKYILVDKTPVLATTADAWMAWFETSPDRVVEQTELHGGAVMVSTVFLGIDHQFGTGPPLLFETMVFPDASLERLGPADDDLTERYSTWDEAKAGHDRTVATVLAR